MWSWSQTEVDLLWLRKREGTSSSWRARWGSVSPAPKTIRAPRQAMKDRKTNFWTPMTTIIRPRCIQTRVPCEYKLLCSKEYILKFFIYGFEDDGRRSKQLRGNSVRKEVSYLGLLNVLHLVWVLVEISGLYYQLLRTSSLGVGHHN